MNRLNYYASHPRIELMIHESMDLIVAIRCCQTCHFKTEETVASWDIPMGRAKPYWNGYRGKEGSHEGGAA